MLQRIHRVTLNFAPALAIGFLACLGLVAAVIAARQLPADAQFAEDAEFEYPNVKIGDDTLRMAVGGKVYNQDNIIIPPNSAPPTAAVLYRIDFRGEISQIWILTDEEAKDYARRPAKTLDPSGTGADTTQ